MNMTVSRFSRFALAMMAVAWGLAGFAGTAAAEPNVKVIGKYGAWQAYSYTEADGSKVCYMAAEPTRDEGNYSRRGKIYAQITHRPGETPAARDTFSYIAGYSYRADSTVTLTIDGNNFSLFVADDTAWATDAATDSRIAQSLRKGSRMVVRGTSSRGTATTDTFSLTGSGAAHDAINRECGIR